MASAEGVGKVLLQNEQVLCPEDGLSIGDVSPDLLNPKKMKTLSI